MAPPTGFRFFRLFPILFILIIGIFARSSSAAIAGDHLRSTSTGGSNRRRKTDEPLPNCSDLANKLNCLKNSKCRWCRSDALDDMCFSKSEAFRLPSQVFSCD